MAYDMKQMREDAVRRAREMHSRAMPSFQHETVENVENSVERVENSENQALNSDFLQHFFQDKEKMLILALLVILSSEKENNSLLFALMYLLI